VSIDFKRMRCGLAAAAAFRAGVPPAARLVPGRFTAAFVTFAAFFVGFFAAMPDLLTAT
jgi:hypothetical protein